MNANVSRFAILLVAGSLAATVPAHAQGHKSNTSTGKKAGSKATTGKNNTADGFKSLSKNKTGSFNTAVGSNALKKATGDSNVGIGYEALKKNKGGQFNVAIGDGAMKFNVNGNNNVALGMDAGALTNGSDNILIDHQGVQGESGTIRIGTPGTHNKTVIAGKIIGDGSGLTGVTANALPATIAGAHTFQGSQTIEGDGSVALSLQGNFNGGAETMLSLLNGTGEQQWHLNLLGTDNGDLDFVESGAADHRLYLKAGGNIGIGTNAPAAKLDVRGDIKLGSSGQYQATASEEKLRIVRGRVDLNGSILNGSGFTAQRLSTGVYRISFSSFFTDVPAVTCSGNYLNIDAYVIDAGQAQFDVRQFDSATNTPNDAGFSFIAAGAR